MSCSGFLLCREAGRLAFLPLRRPAGKAEVVDARFMLELGQLRGIFAVYLRELVERFRSPIYGPLAEVLYGPDALDYVVDRQYALYCDLLHELRVLFCALDAPTFASRRSLSTTGAA